MDFSRDVRITMMAFTVMCLAAAANMLFFQGRRYQDFAGPQHSARTQSDATPAVAGVPEDIVQNTSQPSQPFAIARAPSPVVTAVPQAVLARPASALRTGGVDATEARLGPAMDPVELVRGVQISLAARGYEPGQSDGIAGLITRAAILAYEYDNGLVMTAEPTRELITHMLVGAAGAAAPRRGAPELRGTHASDIVKWTARQLTNLGYDAGPADGSFGAPLVKAIRDYETAQKLPVTGRISAPLVIRLSRPPATAKSAAIAPPQPVARLRRAMAPPVTRQDALSSGPPVVLE